MKFLFALFTALFVAVSQAETLTFITLTGVGSLSDTAIRQAAPAIEKHTGKKVVVVNMPGANGLIGLRHFFSKSHDGNTLLVGNSAISYLRETKQIEADPTPLVGLAKTEMFVYTHIGIPSLKSLLAHPDLNTGAPSPMTELNIRLFDTSNNIKTTVVGYKQLSQAVIDLTAGRIDYLIAPSGVPVIESMVSAGKIHNVQSLGSKFAWNAVFTPPGASNPVLAGQLAKALEETLFTGVQRFSAGSAAVAELQSAEAALIRAALSSQRMSDGTTK